MGFLRGEGGVFWRPHAQNCSPGNVSYLQWRKINFLKRSSLPSPSNGYSKAQAVKNLPVPLSPSLSPAPACRGRALSPVGPHHSADAIFEFAGGSGSFLPFALPKRPLFHPPPSALPRGFSVPLSRPAFSPPPLDGRWPRKGRNRWQGSRTAFRGANRRSDGKLAADDAHVAGFLTFCLKHRGKCDRAIFSTNMWVASIGF